ncbi:MAG: hypothetical protein JWO83_2353 [Caulobacteraceae bacterium]|nr:hypothetical protein [Caulobacteraceae bacterium]
MKQTTFCVPLEVKPDSCSRLSALIEHMKATEDTGAGGYPENFARLEREVPTLHFMSMSVFPGSEFDPIFILEANIDGSPGVFWGQLEAAIGDSLRDVVRCCKRPLDEGGPLHDAVTAPNSRAPIAPYFEARTQQPSVFHHGNRGMTRDRILREDALFAAVRSTIDNPDRIGPSPYRGTDAAQVHDRLRAELAPDFGWLDDPTETRIPAAERAADLARLASFAVTTLLVLSLPGLMLAPLLALVVRSLPRLPDARVLLSVSYVAIIVVVALGFGLAAYRRRKPLPGTGVDTNVNLLPTLLSGAPRTAGFVLVYLFVTSLLLTPLVVGAGWLLHQFGVAATPTFFAAWRSTAIYVLWGLLGIVVSVALIVFWLRYLERRDSSHDAPHVDERMLREMVRREDWIAQNHMGSIVMIKPGVLRTIIIRAGHLGLGLLLRWTATNGYLGSMRTVHFAHWAFLNNGSRLLFFSNFDHSWDSYLDDFIEKAHVGLTLAWGCGVGFPPARFLILDGASHGRQFKAWALASRAVSRFWYSAYRDLTVDQIERNNRIADGLRQRQLSQTEAAAWIRNL